MLGVLLHAPRGPFYSPKAARSCWVHSRKAFLAFCCLAHRTLSGADLFPYLAKPTVAVLEPLAHRTLSGAHRTVRCTPDSPVLHPTVGTCHSSRADSAVDRWPGWLLAHRTVRCTPDSPVNYIRTPLITSREQQVRLSQPGAPDSPVHPDRADFGWTNPFLISTWFFLFSALRHNTLVPKTMY
jgi:hypothetical protein